MQLSNLLCNLFTILWAMLFFTACGDHSKAKVTTDNQSTPLINITSGPYEVVVNKDLVVGIETRYAAQEPIYSAVPSPIGIAIVNKIQPGQIFITGLKPGTTTFTITDLANPKAVAREISVTVKEAPKLVIKPDTLSGKAGQSILLEISTSNPEITPVYSITSSDSSIARIIDVVNNPNLLSLIKAGTTTITIRDTANNLAKEFSLIVTN